MLHDVVMMCIRVQFYIRVVKLFGNVKEQYVTICNISFDVGIELQQCAYGYNHVHSCYNV